jgi:hypothetical protein
MQKKTFSLNVLDEVDEEILSRLEQMNIDKRQARKCILSNQHNTVTTTYYLLLKQKLLNGGTIITAQMMGRQVSASPQLQLRELKDTSIKPHVSSPTVPKKPTPTSVIGGGGLFQYSPASTSRREGLSKYKFAKILEEDMKSKITVNAKPTVKQPLQLKRTLLLNLDSDPVEEPNCPPIKTNSPIKQLYLGYNRRTTDKPDVLDTETSIHASPKAPKTSDLEDVVKPSILPSSIRSSKYTLASTNTKRFVLPSSSACITPTGQSGAPGRDSIGKVKESNIYLNIQKLTSSSKASTISGRSKNESKSNSVSRDRTSIMKSLDLVLDRSAATYRKTSNHSLKSSIMEDSSLSLKAQSFLNPQSITTNSTEQAVRKSKTAFSLDLVTEIQPKEIIAALTSQLKNLNINYLQKVNSDLTQGGFKLNIILGPSISHSLEVVEVSCFPGLYTFEVEYLEKSKIGPANSLAKKKLQSIIHAVLSS